MRRSLIEAIEQRIPSGMGKDQRSAPKSRPVDRALGCRVAVEGASQQVCEALGIPPEWAQRCEEAFHVGHDGTRDALEGRLAWLNRPGAFKSFADRVRQLGSYGGGNHFGEREAVELVDCARLRPAAEAFGLEDGHVAFLSHCGSRGFGYTLANQQFRTLQEMFEKWSIPLPGQDRQLVYAPLGTPQADAYLDDMAMGGNFATVNHLLINALVLEAFQEVILGTTGRLVYFISHNIARKEVVDGRSRITRFRKPSTSSRRCR